MGNCCDAISKQPHTTKHIVVSEEDNRELSLRFKEQGNQLMEQQLFKDAIAAYSEAIKIYNKDSVYYSNRAVAFRIIHEYEQVKRDAYTALELNNQNVRAYYILGTVLLITAQRDGNLISVVDGLNFLIQGNTGVYLAQKYINLKPQLGHHINSNYSKGIILQKQLEKSSLYQEFLVFKEQMKNRYQNLIDLENFTYQGFHGSYIPKSVEFYQCIITQDLITEPALLSSGHTYERKAILECTRVNGPQDPTTRQNISSIIITNIQIKDAIADYMNNYLEFQ